MLATSLMRYQARAITTAQVIEELIELAREMREAASRGEDLGLGADEIAFYDALGTNDSAVRFSATTPFGQSLGTSPRRSRRTPASTGSRRRAFGRRCVWR
jgi:type I site-specific restriction-modification system R (restriction) subunit